MRGRRRVRRRRCHVRCSVLRRRRRVLRWRRRVLRRSRRGWRVQGRRRCVARVMALPVAGRRRRGHQKGRGGGRGHRKGRSGGRRGARRISWFKRRLLRWRRRCKCWRRGWGRRVAQERRAVRGCGRGRRKRRRLCCGRGRWRRGRVLLLRRRLERWRRERRRRLRLWEGKLRGWRLLCGHHVATIGRRRVGRLPRGRAAATAAARWEPLYALWRRRSAVEGCYRRGPLAFRKWHHRCGG